MTIDQAMKEPNWGTSTESQATLKPSHTSPNLGNLVTDDTQVPQNTGWTGFLRRRGSAVDFLSKTNSLDVPASANDRKTSLTPEMDQIPTHLLERKGSVDIPSPSTSPGRGSILQGFMGIGGVRRGSIMEAEEDIKPPENLPRRGSSMADAFGWLFKPMSVQPQIESRHINVFSPTST